MTDSELVAHIVKENAKLISSATDKVDLYGQLAEEAIELAKVALKLQRLEKGTNLPFMDLPNGLKTVMTKEKAFEDLAEEASDVQLLMMVLDIHPNDNVMKAKSDRWINRLNISGN